MRILAARRVVPVVLVAAVAVLSFLLSGETDSKEYHVQLGETGFSPERLVITKGDKVVFATKGGESFWPASNLHPSHTIYPAFDPKEPIDPEETWTMQFGRVGLWGYHDHLNPLFWGEIVVLEKGGQKASLSFLDACKDKDREKQCWEKIIQETLEKRGVAAAFDVVESIYAVHPDCHDYAHLIGEEAWRLFEAGENMELTSKTYYCGYGFYHGFMETLLHTTGDMQEARRFCSYVDQQLSQQITGAGTACFHGIGHGAVDGQDPRHWGDIEAMIEPGIELCEMAARTDFQLYLCSTGVFNAIEILSQDPKYKLTIAKEDPYWLCDRQPGKYKEACYTNMLPALWRALEWDVPAIVSRIEAIEEKETDYSVRSGREQVVQQAPNYRVRTVVLSALFHEYARADLQGAKEGIEVCRSFKDPRSGLACIDGLSGAFMKYGEPNVEYIKGLQFCSLDMLAADEKAVCFEHILSRLRLWYSKDKANQICQSAPKEYQTFCMSQ